jgi:hypothetical protein
MAAGAGPTTRGPSCRPWSLVRSTGGVRLENSRTFCKARQAACAATRPQVLSSSLGQHTVTLRVLVSLWYRRVVPVCSACAIFPTHAHHGNCKPVRASAMCNQRGGDRAVMAVSVYCPDMKQIRNRSRARRRPTNFGQSSAKKVTTAPVLVAVCQTAVTWSGSSVGHPSTKHH